LKVFLRKAKATNVNEQGTAAIETYVDLLDRVGRHREAIDAAIELVPKEVPPQRIVPLLLEIAHRAKQAGDSDAFDSVAGYCRDHEDLLGYAAVLQAKASA
ncbi:MAG: hypothetical protein AAF394_14510, partial [Planctomycetota bacterium]